jgi:putative transposase
MPEEKGMALDREQMKKLLKERGIKTSAELEGLLREIACAAVEICLDGELTGHLGYEKHERAEGTDENTRNGYGEKTVTSKWGEIKLHPPRDRNGTFSPEIVKKRQRDISGIEDKVISMYAKGMSTRDIRDHIYDIYGHELSAETISVMTDKVLDAAKEWQSRPLQRTYVIVFMDGLMDKRRSEGSIKQGTVYHLVGIDAKGKKTCLGLYIGASESAKYWMGVMNELKNRGVEDVLIFAVDNLAGISDAIHAVFPKSDIQKCVVHQIRNSLRQVSYKDRQEVADDLKTIYKASTRDEAEHALELFAAKWKNKYPHIAKSWYANWAELSTFFKYSPELRRVLYTTNIIESFHRGIRKVTKNRTIFPTEDSILKLYYLAIRDIEKRWTGVLNNWSSIFPQIFIEYEDRLKGFV